ncbi:MAG: peptidoglycan DD-metalloendopeptidase family protein [Roseiflexaceae bacterium]
MAVPCLPSRARQTATRARSAAFRLRFLPHLTLLAVLLATLLPSTAPVRAEPQLSLPTPPGQRWKIIQGYGCGTHTGGEDHFALDLVNMDGATTGAPVRAAADGAIWVWVPRSGTLILSHGDGFYTQYTHLQNTASARIGQQVKRGELIGWAGDRATRGLPHLHFAAFYGKGVAASGRRSVPLSFAEGYTLPNIGGCNQHGGTIMVAGGKPEQTDPPGIRFESQAEVGRWYNSDQAISFSGAGIGGGYRFDWDNDPEDAPLVRPEGGKVTVQLAARGEGLHTLYVRGRDMAGNETLSTFGPFGYDLTPPAVLAAPITDTTQIQSAPDAAPPIQELKVSAGKAADLSWTPAYDRASGVAGYRVYVGTDPAGTSAWFVPAPQVTTEPLAPGSYSLRVQPLDYAGNSGQWTTVATVVSAP